MPFTTLSSRLAALGFLTSLAVGCVITVGDGGKTSDECPDVNSSLKDGKCFCDFDYSWCFPNNDSDLTCCLIGSSDSVTSNDPTNGTTTSNTQPTSGTTTDTPPTSSGTTSELPTSSTTSGTTGTPSECVLDVGPPDSCDANMGENYLCLTVSEECGPEGSKFYECQNGVWVENTSAGDENCEFEQMLDFSYGCINEGDVAKFICGKGPGTSCNNSDPTSCEMDGNTLNQCVYGLLTQFDCLNYCQTVGQNMVTFDYGYCDDQDGFTCLCCDEGEDGCPLGGTTSGTDTGGTTGTTG